jgi:hypothetical protein
MASSSTERKGRGWVRYVVGALVGGIVGGIVAVNVVIYAGIDRGYEASLADVFGQNAVVGVVTVAILVAGPVLGLVTAHRIRRRR